MRTLYSGLASQRQPAEQLGVSTTPLKESLRQLEAEGLVETPARRGVIIRFDANWAEETIRAKAALESMIARLAGKRRGQNEITIDQTRSATMN